MNFFKRFLSFGVSSQKSLEDLKKDLQAVAPQELSTKRGGRKFNLEGNIWHLGCGGITPQ